jgi:uncharacterized protein
MTIKEIFNNNRNIAVYGMSSNEYKPAHYVPVYLMNNGYKIYPIHPVADEIAGLKVNKKIMDVTGEIDILNVFRPSEHCLDVVQEAVERKKAKGDIKLIWLQLGIENNEAKKLAEENGIEFIQNKCMYEEHKHL